MVSAQHLRGARRGGNLLAGRPKILGEGGNENLYPPLITHHGRIQDLATGADFQPRSCEEKLFFAVFGDMRLDRIGRAVFWHFRVKAVV